MANRMPTRRKNTSYGSVYEPMLGSIAQPKRRLWPLALAIVAAVAIVAIAAFSCSNAKAADEQSAAAAAAGAAADDGYGRVTFVAVGDNLPDDVIGGYADSLAGEKGDGQYDYKPIFENIKPYIETADLAYVNQETHVGGNDIGPKGYPSFNTTDEMADAIVDTGFDLVASATNHGYDWGTYGANEHSRAVWNELPVVFTGTATSEEEASEIPIIERNGIKFSFLNYASFINGFDPEDIPSYTINLMDEERMRRDVAYAKENSDVVLVAMHWGTELNTGIDEEQQHYAKFLADLGVDVIMGSHPHVIGPVAWVDGQNGHKTLVAYSLGNFLSRFVEPKPIDELEGMLSCTFTLGDYGVDITDVKWTPLVNHTEANYFSIYTLDDYTNELGAKHTVLNQLDDPVGWLRKANDEIVDSGFATSFYEPPTDAENAMHISRDAKLN